MRKLSLSVLALVVAGPVFAADLCPAHPKADWMSKEAITKMLTEQGYEVKNVKEEDGCWELKGSKDGKRVEAYFDPVSGALVHTK